MSLFDDLKYWLAPKETGYNVTKTSVYAVIFVIAVYFIYQILEKLKIKIDRKLALAIAPFILFGSTLRVLQDAGTVNSYLFVTPGIYVFVFLIAMLTLFISLLLQKKRGIPYFKPMFITGLILFSISIATLKPVNFYGAALVILFYLPWIIIFYLFKRWNLTNRIVTSIQMFDASATFVALQFFGVSISSASFGFYEQHILPTFLINMFGPISFIFVKLIIVVLILSLIDKFSEDKNFSNYLKLIIAILGGATGTRDFIALTTMIG